MPKYTDVSIVLPAKNEAEGLALLLPKLRKISGDLEILVVDDGSDDNTVDVCRENQVRVISHPYSMDLISERTACCMPFSNRVEQESWIVNVSAGIIVSGLRRSLAMNS